MIRDHEMTEVVVDVVQLGEIEVRRYVMVQPDESGTGIQTTTWTECRWPDGTQLTLDQR